MQLRLLCRLNTRFFLAPTQIFLTTSFLLRAEPGFLGLALRAIFRFLSLPCRLLGRSLLRLFVCDAILFEAHQLIE